MGKRCDILNKVDMGLFSDEDLEIVVGNSFREVTFGETLGFLECSKSLGTYSSISAEIERQIGILSSSSIPGMGYRRNIKVLEKVKEIVDEYCKQFENSAA